MEKPKDCCFRQRERNGREEALIVVESTDGSFTRTTPNVFAFAPQRKHKEPKSNPRVEARTKQKHDQRTNKLQIRRIE